MKLKIEIKMDNAAFNEADAGIELQRILDRLAGDLAVSDVRAGFSAMLRDVNGNNCGFAKTVK